MNTEIKNVLKIFCCSILIKIIYFAFATIFFGNSIQLSVDGYKNLIKQNDSWWYEKITTDGYPIVTDKIELGYHNGADYSQSSWAFFPAYPVMIKVMMKLFNTDFNSSAMILSLIFSFLSLLGFYYLIRIYIGDEKEAFFISLVFLLFPFHYYYSMMYTEAIFFTCLIFSFLAIHYQKKWALLFLLSGLVLIRPNGIIMLIPIYLFYLEREKIIAGKRFDWKLLFSSKNIFQSLVFLIAPLVFIAYCFYQKQLTGYFFAFSLAQAGWGKEFMFPALAFFRSGDLQSQFNSIYVLIVMAYAVFICRKISLSWNVLIWLSLLFPLCSGSVISMHRYISVIFPLTFILGQQIYSIKFKNIRYASLFVLLALQLFVFCFWIKGHSFSW